MIGLDHRYVGTCGSELAVQNQNLVLLDHCLNQRSVVHMSQNLVAPPPLMGKEKGVSDGKKVNFGQIKGQNAAQMNEGFPYNSFSFNFMSKTMRQSEE